MRHTKDGLPVVSREVRDGQEVIHHGLGTTIRPVPDPTRCGLDCDCSVDPVTGTPFAPDSVLGGTAIEEAWLARHR